MSWSWKKLINPTRLKIPVGYNKQVTLAALKLNKNDIMRWGGHITDHHVLASAVMQGMSQTSVYHTCNGWWSDCTRSHVCNWDA